MKSYFHHWRKDLPGLAHFLEHMLFTGTAKYPKEGVVRPGDATASWKWWFVVNSIAVSSICSTYLCDHHFSSSKWAFFASFFAQNERSLGGSSPGEYHEFMQQNGGESNAYTACYFTCYMHGAPGPQDSRPADLFDGFFDGKMVTLFSDLAVCQNPGTVPWTPSHSWDLWMFIPLKMVLIGIDPYPFWKGDSDFDHQLCPGLRWNLK